MRKLYENFHIFHFQKKVPVETISGNTVIRYVTMIGHSGGAQGKLGYICSFKACGKQILYPSYEFLTRKLEDIVIPRIERDSFLY